MFDYIVLLGVLLFLHSLADYALQGDFMARAKNIQEPFLGIPWWFPMGSHSLIHAGFVYMATGAWELFVVEFIGHFVIDTQKCRGEITFTQDQIAHMVMKILYVGYLAL